VRDVNKEVNENQRNAEMLHRLWQIQNAFIPPMPEPIVEPHRKLVYDGQLVERHKPSMWTDSVKPIYAFLFNDCLLYGYLGQTVPSIRKLLSSKSHPGAIELEKRFLSYRIIGLSDVQLQKEIPEGADEFALLVPAKNHRHRFRAKSEVLDQWRSVLEQTIAQNQDSVHRSPISVNEHYSATYFWKTWQGKTVIVMLSSIAAFVLLCVLLLVLLVRLLL